LEDPKKSLQVPGQAVTTGQATSVGAQSDLQIGSKTLLLAYFMSNGVQTGSILEKSIDVDYPMDRFMRE
jgi:hypothetical protein